MDKYFLSIAGFLLSVLMLSSCSKKDNAGIGFPQGTFSSKNILKVYKTELYTNKGKTNDETIIENFMSRKSLKHIFLDSQIETIYQFIPFTIEIDEEGNFTSTSFHNPYASGKVERLKGNELLLPGNDSTSRYLPINSTGGTLFSCPVDFVLRFPPSFKCTPLPSGTGYSQVCKTRILIPVVVKNSSSLAIPIFTIFQSSHSKGNCYVQDQSNFIKEDFYKNLLDGDTVLIQRKEHLLEKM